ncbi:PadR family transcriptional regulator [Listeria ilorinensis]|uniref:PadR family transcriptional regulator n=1 Tax=Listeria ilorinensis TaxID=2867439 RepID=UPI001EF5F35F|nr:helix-turn-helix transcriptional regulator [Listeria ilorinensis]
MSLKLVILGVLDQTNVHPYDIKRFLKHYSWEYLFQISDAKIYYAFDTLLKKGDIEVAEIITSEKTPTKTVYKITDSGHRQIEKEIYKVFKKDVLSYKAIYPALLFADYADKNRLLFYLKERLFRIEAELASSVEQQNDQKEHPTGSASAWIIENAIRHLSAEAQWLNELCVQIETVGLETNIRNSIRQFFIQ